MELQRAAIERRLILMIDSGTYRHRRDGYCRFKITSLTVGPTPAETAYVMYDALLEYLGFHRYDDGSFRTYCAGRISLYVMDNILSELRQYGFEILDGFFDVIQHTQSI